MSSKDHKNTEVLGQEYAAEDHSFDELAKGIANGALSRGQLLKLVGAAVLGSVLNSALPEVALAKKHKKKKKKHRHVSGVLPPSPPPPPPPVCSASDAAACNRCGTSSTSGHPCECTTDIMNNPVCFDTVSSGQPCTSNADCQADGKLCLNQEPCGGAQGFFECQSPCIPSPPPPIPDASCQSTGNDTLRVFGHGRLAQTFTAENSGLLSSAQALVNTAGEGTPSHGDWIVQIGTVDQETGIPNSSNNVLASATVPDSEVPQDINTTIMVTFANPPSVVAGQQYALILTRPDAPWVGWIGDLFSIPSPCSGGAFASQTQTGDFENSGFGGGDLFFATFVTVV